jgi:hypothetical protein
MLLQPKPTTVRGSEACLAAPTKKGDEFWKYLKFNDRGRDGDL